MLRTNSTEDAASQVNAEPEAPAPIAESDSRLVTEGEIEPGGWLAGSLRARGIPPQVPALIEREMGPLFDFRRSRPGHRYRVVRTQAGELLEFDYVLSSSDRIEMRLTDTGYHVRRLSSR